MNAYEQSPDFQTFKTKVLSMDDATLMSEIEFNKKCQFFTERAAKRETEGGDRSMHNQLERIKSQYEVMAVEYGRRMLDEKMKRKAKRAPKPKKRR